MCLYVAVSKGMYYRELERYLCVAVSKGMYYRELERCVSLCGCVQGHVL